MWVLARCLAVVTSAGTAGWLVRPSAAAVTALVQSPQAYVDEYGADSAVLVGAQVVVMAVLGWLALAAVLWSIAGATRRADLRRACIRVTPSALRAPLAVALGTGALALTACSTPAGGDTGSAPPSASAPAYAASSDVFDWPAADAAAEPAEAPSAPVTEPGPAPMGSSPAEDTASAPTPLTTVEIAAGDCLWEIASAQLGPQASTGEIAGLVEQIYETNTAVIGDDPDLLAPGTRLSIPAH